MRRNLKKPPPRSRPRPTSPLARLYALLALFVLCVPHWAAAQQFTFRQYGQRDGLSNLSVTSLLQDREGYIWVGTENGLFRRDGTSFERFDDTDVLKDTTIDSIAEDSSGRIWIGTAQGLYMREGRRLLPVRPDGHGLAVLSGARIGAAGPNRLLVIDKEELLELWTAPGSGKWSSRPYFTIEQLHSMPALTHLSGLYVDPRGGVWLGCDERICHAEGGQVQVWDVEGGVPRDTWHTWLLDREGNIWARGLQHIVTLGRDASVFESRDTPTSKLTGAVFKNVPLIEDLQGRIITRSEVGLMRWQGERWEEFSAENGITTPEISSLLVSRDGTVWLGMSGHGVWRWLGYGTFESWALRRDLSSNAVWMILRGPDHSIMMGTRAGCRRIDAVSRVAQPCDFDGLPPGEIQVMAKRADGSLWLGMATGRLLRVAAGERRVQLVTNMPKMRKLFADSSDRLWICSDSGIFVVSAGSTQVETTTPPGELGEIADVTQDESGTLWFATQRGLLRWSNGEWSLLNLQNSAPEGFASVVSAGGGWLWAGGSSHGLMRVHVQGSRAEQVRWITEADIAHAAIYFVQMDSRGWLWAGTDDGFVVFDGRWWRKFGPSDGLIWNDTDQNSVYSDADGSMWIGTSGGLTHVLEPRKLIRTGPLDLRLTRAVLGNTELQPATRQRLPWSRGLALDLHLKDLDFDEPDGRLLKVRLRGLSDAWFDTKDFNIHYPALAPERYTFEAIAVDADHQRVSPLVQLSFEILPPWWQTTTFRIALLVVIGTIVAGAWKWSVLRHDARRMALERELREREMLLDRATRDPLTRLWNRQSILDILARELDAAKKSATPLAIALIDIDHFKRINDTFGHLAGDEVLRTLGAQLSRRIREGDALGRYGGEELLLIVPGSPPHRPFLPIERLRQLIAEIPFSYNSSQIRVTASVGVAWLVSASDTLEDLVARADAALYAAKDAGRDRVQYAASGA
jgi:diguanylate cyclase (GGDEF)-like protein